MTAPCTSQMQSNEFSKNKNNSSFYNNDTSMFGSPYSKILHDPECQSHCCSRSIAQITQGNNFTDTKKVHNGIPYYSNEIILTPTSMEDQFLYDCNISEDPVSEFREIASQTVVDNLGMAYRTLCYENSEETIRYTPYSTSITSAEERRKQRSNYKSVIKRKRRRTVFTTEQIIIMEGVFKKRPYVSREERLFLTQRLNISEKAIKIWFQNRRRVTEKRGKDQSDSYNSDSTVEEVSNDYLTRLDYIESQINENTDDYGFVTLDSKALTELVKVIDNVLSRSVDCHSTLMEKQNNESYLMYEPVSPESSTDDNKDSEDILKWQPSEPEESLQRLIDIQTVLNS